MTDITTATRRLVTDTQEVCTFLADAAHNPRVGFDSETSGLDYPTATLAGFSVYDPTKHDAIYVPLRHTTPDGTLQPWNVSLDAIRPALQEFFKATQLTMHNSGHDMLFFIREGLRFYRTADTHTLATMMQIQSLALKSLALEYRLAAYADILPYRRLIAQVREVPETTLDPKADDDAMQAQFAFTTIDVTQHPRAVQYACDDAVYAYHLYTKLREQYASEVGSEEMADNILSAQFDADTLLTESGAAGYLIDSPTLTGFVTDFTKSVADHEHELRTDIATALGWTLPGVPAPVSTSTVSALPSLFD